MFEKPRILFHLTGLEIAAEVSNPARDAIAVMAGKTGLMDEAVRFTKEVGEPELGAAYLVIALAEVAKKRSAPAALLGAFANLLSQAIVTIESHYSKNPVVTKALLASARGVQLEMALGEDNVSPAVPGAGSPKKSQNFDSALNVLMAEFTYARLDEEQRNRVDVMVEDVMRGAGYSGNELLALYAVPRELQFALYACAMQKLGIKPCIQGEEWRFVSNPFSESAWNEHAEEQAYQYLKEKHGIDERSSNDESGSAGSREEVSFMTNPLFICAMPHPEEDNRLNRIELAEGTIIEYYERPRTIGAVEAGIEQPFECPQIAVFFERATPVLIVRTEKSFGGKLMLCALDTEGRHSNFGSYQEGSGTDQFITKAAEQYQIWKASRP